MKIFLASASPRRSQLLKQINIPHEVVPSSIREELNKKVPPGQLVKEIALLKARDVARNKCGIIIGADTIVYLNKIFGKPNDIRDAKLMLDQLSGKTHYVYTGIALISNIDEYIEVVDFEKTEVKMRKISDDEKLKYLKTNEPFDAAGSYKIQGLASLFIEKIDGCYFNVMGFPIFKFGQLLKRIGLDFWNLMEL